MHDTITAPAPCRWGRRLRGTVFTLAIASTLVMTHGQAHADDILHELVDSKPAEWGIGARARRSRVSKRLQELFVEESAGPSTQDGFGIEFAHRDRRTEFVFGFGYDRYNGQDGYYIERGGQATSPGDVDYVDFRRLRWFTVEATVVGFLRLHKLLAVRYGAGLGLGLLRGQIRRTDSLCTGDRLATDCAPDPNGMQVDDPADLPPVLPVVNALVGLQLRPFDSVSINIEVGIHTMPYVGASTTLYLW